MVEAVNWSGVLSSALPFCGLWTTSLSEHSCHSPAWLYNPCTSSAYVQESHQYPQPPSKCIFKKWLLTVSPQTNDPDLSSVMFSPIAFWVRSKVSQYYGRDGYLVQWLRCQGGCLCPKSECWIWFVAQAADLQLSINAVLGSCRGDLSVVPGTLVGAVDWGHSFRLWLSPSWVFRELAGGSALFHCPTLYIYICLSLPLIK